MKILLCTLNAKFIHSSLALAYLREFCRCDKREIIVREFTINENTEDIMAEIHLEKPDILCFSAYIWNIEPILAICNDYKKVAPDTLIIMGGPEVSHDAADVLKQNPEIDYIVRGEGEYTLKELLENIHIGKPVVDIRGISYRAEDKIIDNPDRELIKNLDVIPSPYYGDLDYYKNRTVYYETSRGCPFNCSYCLSSTIRGVRFFSMERVKKNLHFLIQQGVKEVKFVDRTFNCNEKRAMEIMQFIIDEKGSTKFHFEICADLLSDEMLSFLKQIPPGIFDFEIGIQSTCTAALKAVNRKMDWDRLSNNIKLLKSNDNIHLHLDLIAGLPYEDYDTFKTSFNDVYSLNADIIQLGFLKLLKGSNIRSERREYGYKFQEKPPYMLLENNYISYTEIIKLTKIEDLVDRYYNSNITANSLAYIINHIYSENAFRFYEEFSDYWQKHNLYGYGYKIEMEYTFLKNFLDTYYMEHCFRLNELIKYDYLLNKRAYTLPEGIEGYTPSDAGDLLSSLIKDKSFIDENLPEWKQKSAREIRRYVHLEYFKYNPLADRKTITPVPLFFIYNPTSKKAVRVIIINEQ